MSQKLSNAELHQVFLDSLGQAVEHHSDIGEKPLIVKLAIPYNTTIKAYIFNCTNPPGARQAGEFKSQLILPGQQRGERGNFILEHGVKTLLVGFASVTGSIEDGVFVLWEIKKHLDFAYSANIQVSLHTLLRTFSETLFVTKKRGNGEWIVVARPQMLLAAIQKRIDIDIDLLLEA